MIQISWMNFDYATLRELCTDELYNQYKTLLDTLKLKNEQNVMSDFFYPVSKIDRIEEINGIIELDVMLCAEFKDYVINTSSENYYLSNEKACKSHFKI